MALVGQTYLNLKDKLAQTENGKVTATIIDLYAQSNVLLEDAITLECNDGSSHKTTVRNGLPEIEFRKFYQGVKNTKGEYTQVTDTTSMLSAYSEIDKALADMNNDANQLRLNEADSHIQSMNNKVQTAFFYGNKKANDAAFDGMATRYNKISTKKDTIGAQVIDAGGTGTSNTSIWFVTWGDRHTHMLYPKGSQAGFKHADKGVVTAKDKDGGQFEAYRDYFEWNTGLSVRNYKSTCRIANIDVKKLGTEEAANLIELMIKGYYKVNKNATGGKTVIYCNSTIGSALHIQAQNKANVNLSIDEVAGKPIVNFLGIPVKTCDQILDTEAAVKIVND